MQRKSHNLTGVPLNVFSWQLEALQAAADATDRHSRQRKAVTERDRLWVRRGEQFADVLLRGLHLVGQVLAALFDGVVRLVAL